MNKSSDPNNPEVLCKVTSESEAISLVNELGARGVSVTTTGGFVADFRAEAPGYMTLWVKQCDLESAQKALKDLQANQEEVDWSQVDVGEPEE